MDVRTFKNAESVLSTELVEGRKLFDSESAAAIIIELQPGGEIPEHTTEEDVLFTVLEGTPVVTIGGESALATSQQLVPCAGGVMKGLKNNGPGIAKVLVVKLIQ